MGNDKPIDEFQAHFFVYDTLKYAIESRIVSVLRRASAGQPLGPPPALDLEDLSVRYTRRGELRSAPKPNTYNDIVVRIERAAHQRIKDVQVSGGRSKRFDIRRLHLSPALASKTLVLDTEYRDENRAIFVGGLPMLAALARKDNAVDFQTPLSKALDAIELQVAQATVLSESDPTKEAILFKAAALTTLAASVQMGEQFGELMKVEPVIFASRAF